MNANNGYQDVYKMQPIGIQAQYYAIIAATIKQIDSFRRREILLTILGASILALFGIWSVYHNTFGEPLVQWAKMRRSLTFSNKNPRFFMAGYP